MIQKPEQYLKLVFCKPAAVCAAILDPRLKLKYFQVRIIPTFFFSSTSVMCSTVVYNPG